jgi:anti-sigma-K factor RskA
MIRAHDESMLELAALRAIDALEADEAAVIDQHMSECAECRAEFARSRAAGTALAFSVSTPPPASLRDRVLTSAVKIRRIRAWHQSTLGRAWLAGAAAAVIIGGWVLLHQPAPGQQWAAKCGTADCGTVVASGGVLRLDAHLPALPSGKVYQAWIIHPKQNPIPEPTFTVANGGEGTVAMQAAPGKGDIVAVTVEPEGGSKAPTTKPVLVATLNM